MAIGARLTAPLQGPRGESHRKGLGPRPRGSWAELQGVVLCTPVSRVQRVTLPSLPPSLCSADAAVTAALPWVCRAVSEGGRVAV